MYIKQLSTLGFLLVLAGAVSSVSAQPQEAAQRITPNTALASDGSATPAAQRSTQATFVPSFRGYYGELVADHLAEFPERTESVEEVWTLLAAEPATGKVGRETIIGTDQRVRVNPTTTYPARAAALITFSTGSGSALCTGWFINANTLATAGHCVHRGSGGGAGFYGVGSFRVYPGRNGNASPYGSCTAKTLFTVNGWANGANEEYDYGAIKLNCSIGNTTGWYGFFTSASLNNLPTTIQGYPGDKPLTQWKSTDRVRATSPRQVFYQNDTFGGMSGSPVYYNRSGCGICSMAIHAYGTHGLSPHSNNNHGTRINQEVFNNLISWRNAP